jgi:hypothetical protein
LRNHSKQFPQEAELARVYAHSVAIHLTSLRSTEFELMKVLINELRLIAAYNRSDKQVVSLLINSLSQIFFSLSEVEEGLKAYLQMQWDEVGKEFPEVFSMLEDEGK